MVYRFLDDGTGTVLAEDRRDSILRSVSPVHLQYLQNMGVTASASISIVANGALWGLIACHNETQKTIPYEARAACRALASELSRQIRMRGETDFYREQLPLRKSQDRLTALLSEESTLVAGICRHADKLRVLFGADGFAAVCGEKVQASGACPSEVEIMDLADWLLHKHADPRFATERLADVFPAARAFQNIAAGVLAQRLSLEEQCVLIWFRAEDIQVVNWAGNPHKDVSLGHGEVLSPRASFAVWEETVLGQARTWTLIEQDAAGRLRDDLIGVQQSRKLKDLIQELQVTVGQKQFLIGEVNHRVQNSLQLVASFLSAQSRHQADAAFSQAVDEARRRISAVSLLHRSLYRGAHIGLTDVEQYIRDLIDSLIASMGPEWGPH